MNAINGKSSGSMLKLAPLEVVIEVLNGGWHSNSLQLKVPSLPNLEITNSEPPEDNPNLTIFYTAIK